MVCIALIAALAGCQTEEAASPLSAKLSELSGLVEMKQAQEEAFNQAAADSVLSANGQVNRRGRTRAPRSFFPGRSSA